MWKMATRESELLEELRTIEAEWSAMELTFRRSEELKFDIGEGVDGIIGDWWERSSTSVS